jgi:uncharacterized protein involved in outer membrane biogenesis
MKKKLIWVGGVLVLLLLIALVFGFVFLGSIVKAGVEQVGPVVTKVPVKLEGASLSVFNGSGKLMGFELGNPEGFKTPNAMKVGIVGLSVVPSSVLADKIIVRSIRVEGPEITYEMGAKGNNLSAILANVQSMAGTNQPAPAPTEPAGKSKALQVDEFVITGGKIIVSATMLGGQSATLPLPEIRLANLGQGPEGVTPAELTALALKAVVDATMKVVAERGAGFAKEALGGLSTNATKNLGDQGAKALEKAGGAVGDLFKKKN